MLKKPTEKKLQAAARYFLQRHLDTQELKGEIPGYPCRRCRSLTAPTKSSDYQLEVIFVSFKRSSEVVVRCPKGHIIRTFRVHTKDLVYASEHNYNETTDKPGGALPPKGVVKSGDDNPKTGH